MKSTGLFRFIRITGFFLLFTLFFSCGDKNPLAPVEERADNEIWINDSGFEPATLTISLGESVIFTNKDSETHAIQSGTPSNPTAVFATRNLTKNSSQTITIGQKGSYIYHDIDSHATGTIIVL
ncbi:MAG: cupredoxin domain-containing protein [Deferribacteres bacterium]|nr:cupredoxin domain-containing protein [candidate division KSB1 bacterium]MCB9502437.1 cupredoxin domain-containing protein [Deferribacteres bacterium]